jgi:hypothetical protein
LLNAINLSNKLIKMIKLGIKIYDIVFNFSSKVITCHLY